MLPTTDGYLYVIVYIVCLVGVLSLFWKVWFKANVALNCWFCGYNNIIPRHSKLWWQCSICEQHNGFNKNGDYLKVIPEMFKEWPNTSRKICAMPSEQPKSRNILCAYCTENQNQIVQGLSEFTPSDERHFDEELEDYEIELNKRYGLCVPCRTAVSYHLQQQNQQIQEAHNKNYDTYAKIEKAPRRLNVELHNINSYFVALYKLTHVISLLSAVWLWQKTVLNARTDFILINSSLIFTTGTVFIYLHVQKLNLVGTVVSTLWLLVLIYGNFKTRDSRSLRTNTLSLVMGLEGVYLCYELLVFIAKFWRSTMYKKERKEKVGRLRDSPKLEPVQLTVNNNASNKASEVVTEHLKVLPKSLSKDGIKPLSIVPLGKDGTIPLSKDGTVLKKRPSTPDILEGHLDSMFIQRKPQTDFSPVKDAKEANHVVAALKYRATTSYIQSEHRVAGQLLKPATFSVQLFKPGIFSGKHFPSNFSGDMLRPATFISPTNNIIPNKNCKSKGIDTFVSRMRISSESSDNPIEEKMLQDENSEEEVVQVIENKVTIWKRLKWSNIILLIFIFSLVCNLILAYKLASASQT